MHTYTCYNVNNITLMKHIHTGKLICILHENFMYTHCGYKDKNTFYKCIHYVTNIYMCYTQISVSPNDRTCCPRDVARPKYP